MTKLEYVEIEGFKGLEYVEFEPTDINIVTGRNNTGKTSFLEAIDVAFNPKNIQDFDNNIDTVINIGSEVSSIKKRTSGSDSNITLRHPDDEEVLEYFTRVTTHMSNPPKPFFYLVQIDESMDEESAAIEFEEIITEVFLQNVQDIDLNEIKDDFIVISIDGTDYPYFSAGSESSEIISKVHEQVEEKFSERVDEQIREKEEVSKQVTLGEWNDLVENQMEVLNSLVNQISGKRSEGFIKEPEGMNNLNYITSVEIYKDIEKSDGEEDTLKIDDIGDYIKDANLIDNLKTFTLDHLIFEDKKEGKYQIPYDFMGDGFKAIVGLLWELMDDDVENEIVLLEEPETHMHPGYVREIVYFLIDLAREEDIQLFITTHDSDFINDFFTENLTDEEEAYLEDEFSLLRMEEDSAVVEDYETARENLKDLHLDLRGI